MLLPGARRAQQAGVDQGSCSGAPTASVAQIDFGYAHQELALVKSDRDVFGWDFSGLALVVGLHMVGGDC